MHNLAELYTAQGNTAAATELQQKVVELMEGRNQHQRGHQHSTPPSSSGNNNSNNNSNANSKNSSGMKDSEASTRKAAAIEVPLPPMSTTSDKIDIAKIVQNTSGTTSQEDDTSLELLAKQRAKLPPPETYASRINRPASRKKNKVPVV